MSHHPLSTKLVQRSLEVVKDNGVTEALEYEAQLGNTFSLVTVLIVFSECCLSASLPSRRG
jgi:hypothetical protein